MSSCVERQIENEKADVRGFQGVKGVEIHGKNHKVAVKGGKAKAKAKAAAKTGKHVKSTSSSPTQKEDHKKEEKPQEEVFEVVLRINIHCEECAKEVKHCILKMQGVQTVEADAANNKVIVKGSIDAKKLVELINKRGGRHAQIINQTLISNNINSNNSHQNNTHQLPLVAPQLFIDDNPNSCSLM